MKGSFEKNKKEKFVDLLGFKDSNLSERIEKLIQKNNKTESTKTDNEGEQDTALISNGFTETPQLVNYFFFFFFFCV